jgi:hypothetical protein
VSAARRPARSSANSFAAPAGVDRELRRAGLLLERRRFLRAAGVIAGAGLVPAGCSSVPPALAPPRSAALHVLSPRTYAVVTAAAMRIVGPRGAALVADRTVDVGALSDAWLVRTPALAGALGQALWVLELGVWPLVPKLRPFTALDGAAQDAVLAAGLRSRFELVRSVVRGVRALVLAGFYGHPATRPLTGYPGPFGSDAVTIADAMRD